MSYEYDDENRSVTLTERNGSKVTYVHDEKFRDVKHVYGDGEERFEYNKLNQKTLVVDKLGNRTQYGYDPKGNLTRIIDPLGVKTELKYDDNNQPVYLAVNGECKVKNTYDDAGDLTETIDALGNRYAVTYKKQGQPEIIIQPDGSRIRLGYDARGNINTLTDAVGNISRYLYDALNRVTETVDGNGNVTKYAYDAEGNITEVINGKGDIRSYTYNESNKVTQIRDFDGSTIKREYNVLNRPSKVIDQLGRETLLTYDAMWNLARITEPNGAKTTFFYNESNRLGRIKNANGDVIRYTYDANGKRIGITDEEGNKTHFTYDALGQLIQAEGPEGMKFVYTYTKEGQISSITDALGNTVYAEYNAAGQLIREIDPLGEKREYTYSPLGRLTGITDEAGRKINYTYEPGGQLIRKEFPDGTRETYTYDGNGNIKTYTDPLGNTLTYSYDSLDHITQIEGDQGEIRSYTYDAVGNVTSMTDAAGNRTEYCYTLTGQLSKITDPLGNEVEYTYDERDQLIQIRQSENSGAFGIDADLQQAMKANKEEQADRITWYQRDLEGQIKTITDALGEKEHYRYDRTGQLIEKVDKEGYLTKYSYTGLGDIRSVQYADGREIRFSYNPLRQLEKMEDWLGVTRIENDALGRVVKVTDAKARTVSYTWGKAGERKAITYPGGKQVEYHYDECLRLKEVRAQSTQVTYGYDEFSRLKEKVFTNGLKTEYTYNPVGQLASLSHWTQGSLTDQYRYGYDKIGNKTSVEKKRAGSAEESGIYEYGYDPLQRLQEVKKDGQLLRRYQYDGYGNRTGLLQGEQQIRYTYNQVNQLISRKDSQNEDRYHYDRRGNLTEVWKDGVCTDQYVFGALGRLERAFCHQKGTGADYSYNGLGNRVGKTEGRLPEPGSSVVTIEQLSLIPTKQVDDLLDLTRSYHNLLERDEDGKTASYTWDGNLLGMTGTDGKEYHYGLDGLGSPIRLFDETGGLQQTYGYDEFGNDLYQNQGTDQPFGYTGYQFDTVAGTYFAQIREYAPGNGGFISKDSDQFLHLEIPQSLNQYSYCFQNPILYVDPLGTDVYYYYDPNTFLSERDIEKDVKSDKKTLQKHYGTKVHVKKLTAKQKFIDDWNAMPDEKIDAVVIYSHANHELFRTKSESVIGESGEKESKGVERFTVQDVASNLNSKSIDIMVMLGCNMGATSLDNNIAVEFMKSDNNLGIHKLIASDGNINHGHKNFWFFITHRHTLASKPNIDNYHPDGVHDGFKLYRYVDGQLQWDPIGYEFDSIVELIKAGEALCAE